MSPDITARQRADLARIERVLGPELIRHDVIARRVHDLVLHGADLTDTLLAALRCTLDTNRELMIGATGHLALCSRPMVIEMRRPD